MYLHPYLCILSTIVLIHTTLRHYVHIHTCICYVITVYAHSTMIPSSQCLIWRNTNPRASWLLLRPGLTTESLVPEKLESLPIRVLVPQWLRYLTTQVYMNLPSYRSSSWNPHGTFKAHNWTTTVHFQEIYYFIRLSTLWWGMEVKMHFVTGHFPNS